jgi:peptide/nickel transport system permease protein
MLRYVIRRILGSVLVVFMVSIVTFAIFQLAPALAHRSPIYYYVGKIPFPEGSPQLKLLEQRFGFDKPLVAQYWYWLTGVLFGRTITDGTSTPIHCSAPCLGYSFRLNTSVNTLIAQAIPVSLSLAAAPRYSGSSAASPSARSPGCARNLVDRLGMATALVAVSLPIFFTGPILLLVFNYKLGWLTNLTYEPLTKNPVNGSRA